MCQTRTACARQEEAGQAAVSGCCRLYGQLATDGTAGRSAHEAMHMRHACAHATGGRSQGYIAGTPRAEAGHPPTLLQATTRRPPYSHCRAARLLADLAAQLGAHRSHPVQPHPRHALAVGKLDFGDPQRAGQVAEDGGWGRAPAASLALAAALAPAAAAGGHDTAQRGHLRGQEWGQGAY